jgi:hypothetical protein
LQVVEGPNATGRTLGELLDEIGTKESLIASLGADIVSTDELVADLTSGRETARRAAHGQLSNDVITGACADLEH